MDLVRGRVQSESPAAIPDPEVLPRIVAFRQGLEALGWTEDRNIQVEHRYSGGDSQFGLAAALAGGSVPLPRRERFRLFRL
jgi:hypothetical protein